DTVRLRRNGPGILKERLSGFLGKTVEIEPRHHAQFQRPWISRHKLAGQNAAGACAGSRFTYGQHIASGKLAAGESAQRSESGKRATAQHDRDIAPAGYGDVAPRSRFHEIEGEVIVRLDRKRLVAPPRLAVDLGCRFRSGDSDDGGSTEDQFGRE